MNLARVSRARAAATLACALAGLLAWAAAQPVPATGATGNTVVTADVTSATTLVPSCAAGSAATAFGTVLPGVNAVTGADCQVQFGSSNDTSMLMVHQTDRSGRAMFAQHFGTIIGSSIWEIAGGPADETSLRASIVPDGSGDTFLAGYEIETELLLVKNDWGGILDTSWSSGDGSDGYLKVPGVQVDASVAVQAAVDGSVTVAVADTAADGGVRVLRWLADGTADTSFGSGGSITHDLCDPNGSTNAERYPGMHVDDDGSIWLAGTCAVTPGTDEQWIVARLDAAGALDTSFSGDGIWEWDPDATRLDAVAGLVRASSGVYVAGTAQVAGEQAAAVVHLLEDGTLDPAFDGDGTNLASGNGTVAYVETSGDEHLVLAVTGDLAGNVFLGARTSDGTEAARDTAILRIDGSTGSPSSTFGSSGWSVQDVASGAADEPRAMLADGDGSVMVTGEVGNDADNEDAYLMRLTRRGGLDVNYDSDGVRTVEFTAGQDNRGADLVRGLDGYALLIQDGDFTSGDGYFVRTKLGTDYVPDYLDVGGGSDRDWSSDPSWTSMFAMCLRLLGGTASASAFAEDAGNDCQATDSDDWYAVPATPGASAKLATATTGVTTGTVALRFGFRPSEDRSPGSYFAPITFEVLAPDA